MVATTIRQYRSSISNEIDKKKDEVKFFKGEFVRIKILKRLKMSSICIS